MRGERERAEGQLLPEQVDDWKISPIGMPPQGSTPSEHQRVFAEIAQDRPDAIWRVAREDAEASRCLPGGASCCRDIARTSARSRAVPSERSSPSLARAFLRQML
jgi:hypothetical protein